MTSARISKIIFTMNPRDRAIFLECMRIGMSFAAIPVSFFLIFSFFIIFSFLLTTDHCYRKNTVNFEICLLENSDKIDRYHLLFMVCAMFTLFAGFFSVVSGVTLFWNKPIEIIVQRITTRNIDDIRKLQRHAPPEDDDIPRETACVVCTARPRIILCAPCNHLSMCAMCAPGVLENRARCPVCMASVVSAGKLFT